MDDRERRRRGREIGNADALLAGRYWLTAKAARLLGHDVPAQVSDDVAVTFVPSDDEAR